MPLEDVGALIQSGMNLVPDYNQSVAFKVGLDSERLQQQLVQQQVIAAQAKEARAKTFQQDLATAMQKPDASSISGLIMKYPEFADQLKSGWDVRDDAAKQGDLTQLGEMYSAASSGRWDLVSKSAHARLEADKAAGQVDPLDQEIVDAIDSGNETKRKAVAGLIGVHLAAATGPEHFGTVYGALNPSDSYTLGPGDARFQGGRMVAHSEMIQAADGSLYPWNEVMNGKGGGPAQGSPDAPSSGMVSPGTAAVASVLSSSGLPAPVIAGFMGNFHAEGGYKGAQGDGGSASGIAQWRNERAANFQKIIGKPVTEASPEEQAKFVAWEMQNPAAAGMTVKQRDAILAAKTPAQAAALIDQHYERSSGRDRKVRMTAAEAFARDGGVSGGSADASPGGLHPLLPGRQREAPSGYRWSADGSQLEKIPGGPADASSTPVIRAMTNAEKAERGLDPNTSYKINTQTGDFNAVSGQQRQAKQIPQQVAGRVQPAIDIRDTMARLAGTWKNSFGGHTVLGGSLNSVQSWANVGPEGMRDWWADFQGMDNIVRNQLFGSALTEHEKQAYAATTITPRMSPEQIRKNFNRRRQIINSVVGRQQNFLKKNGYDPDAVDALFQPLGAPPQSSPSPVRVRTVQEAQRLSPGTLYVAPDGKVRRR